MTNLDAEADELHDRVYRQRGDMENRIEEQRLDLFADRTSTTKWWADQHRRRLAGLACLLLETMRRTTPARGETPSTGPGEPLRDPRRRLLPSFREPETLREKPNEPPESRASRFVQYPG